MLSKNIVFITVSGPVGHESIVFITKFAILMDSAGLPSPQTPLSQREVQHKENPRLEADRENHRLGLSLQQTQVI